MAETRRAAPWPEGEYVLTVDKFRRDEEDYVEGDTIVLDEADATRLGFGGAIAEPDSLEARKALAAASGSEKDQKLVRAETLEAEARKLREEAGREG